MAPQVMILRLKSQPKRNLHKVISRRLSNQRKKKLTTLPVVTALLQVMTHLQTKLKLRNSRWRTHLRQELRTLKKRKQSPRLIVKVSNRKEVTNLKMTPNLMLSNKKAEVSHQWRMMEIRLKQEVMFRKEANPLSIMEVIQMVRLFLLPIVEKDSRRARMKKKIQL